ncbi:1,4-alpha-glucan branching enzyme GlgB [Rhizobium sp. CECT 9324]|nr:1,4-alpha-glucan branching enzyme GlgB [Rhizobium sp. CECT 9324]
MHDTFAIKSRKLRAKVASTWGPDFIGTGTRFRLWAPNEKHVALRLSDDHAMMRSDDGWFEVVIDRQPFDEPYAFVLGDGTIVADPASRQQVSEVSGLSLLPDPNVYRWKNSLWRGRPWHETVVYEIHIGTFTPEGTFQAATSKLERLADLGFTAIEVMPVAHFPGQRGWGYDGVLHYAPHNAYGTPDDFKAFIDTAHGLGLMVFLDVVYNHFGPEGNFLSRYAPEFFREGKSNPWGAEIAFDREPVRRFFVDNALYWLEEFRLDGLRFDAVNEIKDPSSTHILEELSTTVRRVLADRHIHLITENPPNGTDLLSQELFVADWNDSFHHVVHVIATGEDTGLYEEFKHAPFDKLRKILSEGYLEPGEPIVSEFLPPSACLAPTAFVHFLQNHDQVGNRALGDRLHTSIDETLHRVLTSMLLLSPQVPLLFMGDCYRESGPFHYFADYRGEVAEAIRNDRPQQAENFGGYPQGASASDMPDPHALSTFLDSKLDWSHAETQKAREWSSWLQALLAVRRDMIVPHLAATEHYSGTVSDAPDGCVFIDWVLGDMVLHMRANLSRTIVPLDDGPDHCIWQEGQQCAAGSLAPISVKIFCRRS